MNPNSYEPRERTLQSVEIEDSGVLVVGDAIEERGPLGTFYYWGVGTEVFPLGPETQTAPGCFRQDYTEESLKGESLASFLAAHGPRIAEIAFATHDQPEPEPDPEPESDEDYDPTL